MSSGLFSKKCIQIYVVDLRVINKTSQRRNENISILGYGRTNIRRNFSVLNDSKFLVLKKYELTALLNQYLKFDLNLF